jgi:hypothetical protein
MSVNQYASEGAWESHPTLCMAVRNHLHFRLSQSPEGEASGHRPPAMPRQWCKDFRRSQYDLFFQSSESFLRNWTGTGPQWRASLRRFRTSGSRTYQRERAEAEAAARKRAATATAAADEDKENRFDRPLVDVDFARPCELDCDEHERPEGYPAHRRGGARPPQPGPAPVQGPAAEAGEEGDESSEALLYAIADSMPEPGHNHHRQHSSNGGGGGGGGARDNDDDEVSMSDEEVGSGPPTPTPEDEEEMQREMESRSE